MLVELSREELVDTLEALDNLIEELMVDTGFVEDENGNKVEEAETPEILAQLNRARALYAKLEKLFS